MDNRRQFLAKAAFLSGAAGLSGGLIGSIERAMAIEPISSSTFWDAEHVVILMQENRSFDHAFGTLRGVRGFNDPRAIKLPNGNPVWVQTNHKGESYTPFRLNLKDSSATWMGCLPHGWTDQVDARNEGHYDRWLDVKRSGEGRYADMPLTLGYYNRDDIPFYYALADAFTICDQHFCSSLTGTTPNRCYLWSGTIRAQQNAQSPANVLNTNADHETNVSWPTFPERLEDLGVSWKVYQNEVSVGVGLSGEEDAWLSNFGDNPLEYFTQFNVRLLPAYRKYLEASAESLPKEIAELQQKLKASSTSNEEKTKLADRIDEAKNRLNEINNARLRWNQSSYDRLSSREKNLLAKAFCTNSGDPNYHQLSEISYRDNGVEHRVEVPKGDVLHQFRQDVSRGTLPTVSWVVPPERFSDHPGSAWYGAWYIAEMLDILTRNPEVWKKTIFVLTYDENDGYFDHVPPFVVPDPRRPETGLVSSGIDASLEYVTREDEMKRKAAGDSRDSPIGLGYRVPLIVASPWTRGGNVCSQVFDHTSPLQFLEKFLTKKLGKDVHETNITEWRRAVCGDLTSVFQKQDTSNGEELFFPKRDEFIEQIHKTQFKALPSGYRKLSQEDIDELRRHPNSSSFLPRQEPGTRPSCALPYELVADGNLSQDRRRFSLVFEARNEHFGNAAAGAPFTAYATLKPNDVRMRNYAVTAGGRLEDAWSLGDFAAHGYLLSVHGPNGFYREFRGDGQDPPLTISCICNLTVEETHPQPAIAIEIVNCDKIATHEVEVVDNAYQSDSQRATIAPGESKKLLHNSEHTFGWYDLTIRVAGSELLSKRYAGRIETGKPSFSDPVIGGVV